MLSLALPRIVLVDFVARALLLLFVASLFGCASTSQKSTNENGGYTLLFSTRTSNICSAVYYKKKMLFLITKQHYDFRGESYDIAEVSIVDPKTGLLTSTIKSKSDSCLSVNLMDPDLGKYNDWEINVITSPGLKIALNSVLWEPTALKTSLDGGPPYFRWNGIWTGENEKSAVVLNPHFTVKRAFYPHLALGRVENIQQAATELQKVDMSLLQPYIDKRLREMELEKVKPTYKCNPLLRACP